MAILDELKSKIGPNADSARNIEEAVSAMHSAPLYVYITKETTDSPVVSNVSVEDIFRAAYGKREVIVRTNRMSSYAESDGLRYVFQRVNDNAGVLKYQLISTQKINNVNYCVISTIMILENNPTISWRDTYIKTA